MYSTLYMHNIHMYADKLYIVQITYLVLFKQSLYPCLRFGANINVNQNLGSKRLNISNGIQWLKGIYFNSTFSNNLHSFQIKFQVANKLKFWILNPKFIWQSYGHL